MSQVKVLDLKGINVNNFVRKPRGGVKSNFQISAPQEDVATCTIPGKCLLFLAVIGLLSICIVGAMTVRPSAPTTVHKQLSTSLRKIIRMQCQHDASTHCSTSHEGGEYVVNINNCVDIYEFNGIPFTDILKDSQDNYHVPPSQDMTLVVNKACKTITATYDTEARYKMEHAVKNSKGGRLKKIVWIPSKDCYASFTLVIDKQVILDETPAAMIDNERLQNITAYTYNVGVDIEGSVRVSGSGCDVPIHVYTLRV